MTESAWHERLRKQRERLWPKQGDGARALQVGPAQLSRYESGAVEPGLGFLRRAAAHGIDVLFVLTGRPEQRGAETSTALPAPDPAQEWSTSAPVTTDTTHRGDTGDQGAAGLLRANASTDLALTWAIGAGKDRREYHVTPHITEHVCAGRAHTADDAQPPRSLAAHARAGVLAFERTYMAQALGSDEDRYMTLHVEGDSMASTLLDGELVAIDVSVQRITVSGIYVLRFGGALTIKRVMRKSDGAVVVASDNRAYAAADETFTAAAAETLAVVGRMVWPRVR